jgi:hypothetical protein
MFSWQQQWNGQSSPTAKNGCCTRPLVKKGSSCAPTLRKVPRSYFLPHSSLTPPPSYFLPHSSPTPPSSLTPPSLLPHSSSLTPPPSLLPHSSSLTPPSLLLPHSSLTPPPSLLLLLPTLRKLCAADSPAQTRVLNYAFSPGSCTGGTGKVPLTAPVQDIASEYLRLRQDCLCSVL